MEYTDNDSLTKRQNNLLKSLYKYEDRDHSAEIRWIPKEELVDKNFVLAALNIGYTVAGKIFKQLPDVLKKDHEVAKTAVFFDAFILNRLSMTQRDDKDIVLAAMQGSICTGPLSLHTNLVFSIVC